MNWLREFFGTLPEAFRALWEFGDGWYSVGITVVSLALFAGFLLLAKVLRRPGHEWLAAVSGVLAGAVAFWWLFGILPSAWVYFADGQRELLEGTVLPGAIPGADNFYQIVRDVVVIAEQGVAVAAFAAAAVVIQKRYPRTLAEGEEKSPATGGYK